MILNELIKSKKIILASASPRRKELMEGLGFDFTIDTGNSFEEIIPQGFDVTKAPEYLAKGKSHGFHRELEKDEIINIKNHLSNDVNFIIGSFYVYNTVINLFK